MRSIGAGDIAAARPDAAGISTGADRPNSIVRILSTKSKHEREAAVRRRSLLDGDDKWDHVGPERDRACAVGRQENERDYD
jgi:hypothetical protein